jgi:hypothetical protein
LDERGLPSSGAALQVSPASIGQASVSLSWLVGWSLPEQTFGPDRVSARVSACWISRVGSTRPRAASWVMLSRAARREGSRRGGPGPVSSGGTRLSLQVPTSQSRGLSICLLGTRTVSGACAPWL